MVTDKHYIFTRQKISSLLDEEGSVRMERDGDRILFARPIRNVGLDACDEMLLSCNKRYMYESSFVVAWECGTDYFKILKNRFGNYNITLPKDSIDFVMRNMDMPEKVWRRANKLKNYKL